MEMNVDVRMMIFHVPDDQALLAAWAVVSIRHSQLDYVLRMTIKTLANLDIVTALDATAFNGSSLLRDRIGKLARRRLGESEALLHLQALLEQCRRLTERRNQLTHNIIARDIDEQEPPRMRGINHQWGPLPTVAELNVLATQLAEVTAELNTGRL